MTITSISKTKCCKLPRTIPDDSSLKKRRLKGYITENRLKCYKIWSIAEPTDSLHNNDISSADHASLGKPDELKNNMSYQHVVIQ